MYLYKNLIIFLAEAFIFTRIIATNITSGQSKSDKNIPEGGKKRKREKMCMFFHAQQLII